MSARVHLDFGSVERASSGAIVGRIWIELGNVAFPEAGWHDFPVTILTWWIEALRDLVRNNSDEASIPFMDGPYEIRLQRVGQAAVATGLHSGSATTPPTETNPEQLLTSALDCAKTLLTEMGREDAGAADLDHLARVARGFD